MCVAAFGEVIELMDKYAIISFKGVTRKISMVLVPKAQVGDIVVVHAGFATEIMKDPHKFYREVVATDAYSRQLLDAIEKENRKLKGHEFKIMNFCGTHENTIEKYALRELLPENIQLVSGPGCPVCVTPEEELALGLQAVKNNNVILTTYGDLLRVPTRWGTLEQMRMEGADIRIVYDITQALELARAAGKEVVHYAVGFETTAPGTASILQEAGDIENFSIISSHRVTPPAMKYVVLNSNMDALLCPGHVAMVTGTEPFDKVCREYKIPCIISGFEPVDVLQSILMLLYKYGEEKHSVINQYSRVVEDKGNLVAQSLINKTFTVKDAHWRGVGMLPKSRLVLNEKYGRFDAELKLGLKMPEIGQTSSNSCICGEILKGVKPQLCPNFRKSCTPLDPKGPCMVTRDGACNIAYNISGG